MKLLKALFFLVLIFSELKALSIDREEIDNLKTNPSLISTIFMQKKNQLILELGQNASFLSNDELFVIFCIITAHHIAPYGDSVATDLNDMLSAPYLNCGNYGLLAVYLAESVNINILNKIKVHFVGWEGDAFGNHQTLFIKNSQPTEIFLDPTTGLVAFCSFDDVASGRKVPDSQIFDFSYWENIQNYKNRINFGLQTGLGKPSDLLYYYFRSDGFLNSCTNEHGNLINPNTSLWMTPAGQKRHFDP